MACRTALFDLLALTNGQCYGSWPGRSAGLCNEQRLGDRRDRPGKMRDVLDLRSVTTAGDTNTDVEVCELIETNNKQGLVNLERGRPSVLLSCNHHMRMSSPNATLLMLIVPFAIKSTFPREGTSRDRRVRARNSYLRSEDGRLDQLERAAVDLDQTLAGLALSDSLFDSQPVSQVVLVLQSVVPSSIVTGVAAGHR